MGFVLGEDSGFCAVAPTADPGAGANVLLDGFAKAWKFTSPAGATSIVEIGWWFAAISGGVNMNWEAGIYTHDAANDKPGTLIAGYATGQSSGATDGIWCRATGLSIAITGATDHWIAVQGDAVAGSVYTLQASSGDLCRVSLIGGQTALQATWPSGSSETAYAQPSVYAVYTTEGGVSIPVLMNSYRQRRA